MLRLETTWLDMLCVTQDDIRPFGSIIGHMKQERGAPISVLTQKFAEWLSAIMYINDLLHYSD
jgi:hypothetical protein